MSCPHGPCCRDAGLRSSHFGINQFFLDNGLDDAYETKLYFPADCVS